MTVGNHGLYVCMCIHVCVRERGGKNASSTRTWIKGSKPKKESSRSPWRRSQWHYFTIKYTLYYTAPYTCHYITTLCCNTKIYCNSRQHTACTSCQNLSTWNVPVRWLYGTYTFYTHVVGNGNITTLDLQKQQTVCSMPLTFFYIKGRWTMSGATMFYMFLLTTAIIASYVYNQKLVYKTAPTW